MRTLYLRNVPDVLIVRLERLAAASGTSVSAAAIRELTDSTRWVDNADLLGALPDQGVPVQTVVADLDEERAAR